jgi:hypothetical protein
MNCESVRQGLSLYLYGELSFDEEERYAQHLDACEGCRRELEREKRLHRAADLGEVRPPGDLLERCRMELGRELWRSNPPAALRPGWLERMCGTLAWPAAAWLKPVAAAALVAIGFFAARIAPGPAPASQAAPAGDPVAVQVRFVEPAPGGGVKLVVDETRQRELSGSLEDEAIRRLLLAAMRDPADPGVRADSVAALGAEGSHEVRDALLWALEHDSNDGVRLKALEGLRRHAREPECRLVLSRVLLADRNPGVRSTAIDLLVQADSRDVVETLQRLLQKEDNSYIRLRSQKALEAMNASVESF